MALIINQTPEKIIYVSGTDLNIPQIYGRVEFVCRANGKNLEATLIPYASKSAFEQGKPIYTTLESGNINVQLKEDEVQSLETAHEYMKQAYEELGYSVTIDL